MGSIRSLYYILVYKVYNDTENISNSADIVEYQNHMRLSSKEIFSMLIFKHQYFLTCKAQDQIKPYISNLVHTAGLRNNLHQSKEWLLIDWCLTPNFSSSNDLKSKELNSHCGLGNQMA